MRTTIDLPDDLHRAAVLLARDRRQTLSRTVVELLRTALQTRRAEPELEQDPQTGLPLVRVGRRITADDVAAAADDS